MTIGSWKVTFARLLMLSTLGGATAVTASAPVYYATHVRSLQEYVETEPQVAKLQVGLACFTGKPQFNHHGNSFDTWIERVIIQGTTVRVVHADTCREI